jgi:outer membrane protein OmpA-like peptidoglycan-associated protein
MSFDLLESFNSALGGPMTRQLSASLDESEDTTRTAVRSVGPSLLAALMQQATTPSGKADLFRAVGSDRVDDGIVGKLGSILGNRGAAESMRRDGISLLGSLLGDRGSALANAISQVSGVRPNSAMSLLSLGMPLILGMLRKHATGASPDASGLASALFSQRGVLERAGLDDRIASALGVGSLSSLLSAVPDTRAAQTTEARPLPSTLGRQTERKRRAWWPWAVAAGVAMLALLLFANMPRDTAETARPTASTSVYFATGETTIDSADRIKIASLAESVKRGDRPVAVTGYTDRSGDSARNIEIAQERAAAVREALVAEGVTESKIVMHPPADVTGAGSDDEARRVDIATR